MGGRKTKKKKGKEKKKNERKCKLNYGAEDDRVLQAEWQAEAIAKGVCVCVY